MSFDHDAALEGLKHDLSSDGESGAEESFNRYTERQENKRQRRLKDAAMRKNKKISAGSHSTVSESINFRLMNPKYTPLVYASQVCVNIFAVLFLTTAAFGGILHVMGAKSNFENDEYNSNYSQEKTDSTTSLLATEDINWTLAREAALLAFSTTWRAIQMWTHLVMLIFVPTSHKTFAMTKEGWVAMQPSLQLSIEWLKNSPPIVKVALSSLAGLVVLVIVFVREIKRRKYVQRLIASYYRMEDRISYSYKRFERSFGERYRFLISFVPHLLFFGSTVAAYSVNPEVVSGFARGLGGWFLVIGIPVIASAVTYIIYDKKYSERVRQLAEKNKRHSRRRPSTLSLPLNDLNFSQATKNQRFAAIKNAFAAVKHVFVPNDTEGDNQSENSDDENDMKPYLATYGKHRNYKTMRGVKPLRYPKFLDQDDDASLAQFKDLEGVLYWLRYWTILATFLCLEQLPLLGHFLTFFPVWPNIRMCLALWLMLPGTQGADLAFQSVVPLVGKYWQKIEVKAPSNQTQNFLLNQVLAALPLPKKTKHMILEVAETGSKTLLTAIPFFFMPTFLTTFGCVTHGTLIPLYEGIVSIVSVEAAAYGTRRRLDKTSLARKRAKTSVKTNLLRVVSLKEEETNTLSVAANSLSCTMWLEYWVVYTSLMFAHGIITPFLYWVPFWVHLQLCLILWLQLPYFRGARRIFKAMLAVVYKIESILSREESDYPREVVSKTVDYSLLAKQSKVRKLSDNIFEMSEEELPEEAMEDLAGVVTEDSGTPSESKEKERNDDDLDELQDANVRVLDTYEEAAENDCTTEPVQSTIKENLDVDGVNKGTVAQQSPGGTSWFPTSWSLWT